MIDAGRGVAAVLVLAVAACAPGAGPRSAGVSPFGSLIAELSEPGQYFDTDNLISNESAYLHVASALDSVPPGGAYIGVGPDQNYSYIALVRPAVAYILDIRRDQMLEHLLFKAVFELAPTRARYSELLLARSPGDSVPWMNSGPAELAGAVARLPADADVAERARAMVDSAVRSFGVALDSSDLATIERFHREFIREGVGLQFRSHGRSPMWYYPTLGDLWSATDTAGVARSFMASEEAYRFVRDLHLADRIIPVTGDFAGDHALRAIGRHAAAQGLVVSAFYTSNVEYYLFQSGSFSRFARNVAELPLGDGSVFIRSIFLGTFGQHPAAQPGHASVQLVQPMRDFVRAFEAGEVRSYRGMVGG